MVQDIEINEKISDDEIIWRYMDFASFYALLQSQTLFFRRIDKYSDRNEGSLPEEVQEYLLYEWSGLFGIETAKGMVSEFCSNLMEFNKGTLCNSWVMNPKEIYAMWKIYLRGSNEGVAIQTTVGRLRGALSIGSENFTLAKVSYEILSWFDTWYKTLPSYKSKPYSYECELRILIFDKFEEESIPIDVFPKLPLYEHGNSYPVDIHNLIDFIYISPFTSQWFHNVIKSTMQFFLPSFDNSKIIFSGIRDK